MLKDKHLSWIRNGGIALILIVALSIFLFSKSGTGPTGWALLKAQDAWYLFTMAAFFLVGCYALWRGIVAYRKTQDAKSFKRAFIVFAIFLAIAFGKGCTDKANSGVTAPSGRVESVNK